MKESTLATKIMIAILCLGVAAYLAIYLVRGWKAELATTRAYIPVRSPPAARERRETIDEMTCWSSRAASELWARSPRAYYLPRPGLESGAGHHPGLHPLHRRGAGGPGHPGAH